MGIRGEPLFRIKHQGASVAVVISKQNLSGATMRQIKDALSEILQSAPSSVGPGRDSELPTSQWIASAREVEADVTVMARPEN